MELTRGNNIPTRTWWLLVFNTGGWDSLENEKGTCLSIFDERVILRKGSLQSPTLARPLHCLTQTSHKVRMSLTFIVKNSCSLKCLLSAIEIH